MSKSRAKEKDEPVKNKAQASKKKSDRKKSDFSSDVLSGLAIDKLNEAVLFLKKELFNLRFQSTLGELTNTSRFAKVRKDIARVKTELSRRRKEGAK